MKSVTAPVLLTTLPENLDRAIVYGDALFETMVVFDGVAPLWRYHEKRLSLSLKRLGIAADIADIESKVMLKASQVGSALLRLVISRSGNQRGYDPRTAQSVVLSIESFVLPAYPRSIIDNGISMHVCQHVLPRNPALAGIKHTNRLDQVLASAEWNRMWEREGLLLDDTGAVVEGTISNIFIIKDGILLTPSLEYCGVSGVMRAWILELAETVLSLPVEIRRITLADILAADECFVCNSVFGVWPVAKMGVACLGTSSRLTETIRRLVWQKGYDRLYA